MDQNSQTDGPDKRANRFKDLAWPAAIAVAVTLTALAVSAIVVNSQRLASPETANNARPVGERLANPPIPAPHLLAQALLAPKADAAAFTTPFFDAAGAPLTLETFKGQGVVLNFWATWCAPCVKEMPALDHLALRLKDRGVRVVTVSEDRKALDVVPAFFTERSIANLDLYFDVKSALSRAIGVEGLPTTVLITADGQEIGRVKGALEWDADPIVDYLVEALAAK